MLGVYDTRPPPNAAALPRCASSAEHVAAVNACKPTVLRGLGDIGRFGTSNPCWIASLPICPGSGPIVHEPPHRAAPRPPVAPPMPMQVQQAGMSTGGILAIAAGALAIGAWIVFGRKKKSSS